MVEQTRKVARRDFFGKAEPVMPLDSSQRGHEFLCLQKLTY